MFIASWAIVLGVFQIIGAIRLRKEIDNEWMLVLGGVLSVLFGVVLLVAPGAGALGADLGDRRLCDRVRGAAGDGGAAAEEASGMSLVSSCRPCAGHRRSVRMFDEVRRGWPGQAGHESGCP